MAMSEAQFRWSVVGAGVALALGIASVRFFGSTKLPPEVAATATVTGTSTQLMSQTSGSQAVYLDLIARDAAAAGVRVPTIDELKQPLPYATDQTRHVLEVGGPPVTTLGLALAAVQSGDSITLEIANTTDKDLAYRIVSVPTPATASCNSARPLPFNAMVIAKGTREVRVECSHRKGLVVAVTRVEVMEVPPLGRWYLSAVPPELAGIEARIARGHRGPQITEKCSPLMGEALRSDIENGEIQWRDLVDFYARHRCQTFQFPMTYRAFTAGDPRDLPVVQ